MQCSLFLFSFLDRNCVTENWTVVTWFTRLLFEGRRAVVETRQWVKWLLVRETCFLHNNNESETRKRTRCQQSFAFESLFLSVHSCRHRPLKVCRWGFLFGSKYKFGGNKEGRCFPPDNLFPSHCKWERETEGLDNTIQYSRSCCRVFEHFFVLSRRFLSNPVFLSLSRYIFLNLVRSLSHLDRKLFYHSFRQTSHGTLLFLFLFFFTRKEVDSYKLSSYFYCHSLFFLEI